MFLFLVRFLQLRPSSSAHAFVAGLSSVAGFGSGFAGAFVGGLQTPHVFAQLYFISMNPPELQKDATQAGALSLHGSAALSSVRRASSRALPLQYRGTLGPLLHGSDLTSSSALACSQYPQVLKQLSFINCSYPGI